MHAPPPTSPRSRPNSRTSARTVAGPSDGPPDPRPRSAWWTWALVSGLFLLYGTVSLRTHERLLSHSFDLAVFEQAVRSYAEGHLPVSEVKGPDFPVLGDHFSPVLAALAPLYWVWPGRPVRGWWWRTG